MKICNKITQYFKNNGHVFICWGIFVMTVAILSSLLAKWIISTEDTATIKSKKAISCDTLYVIVKPELDELRITSYCENKDSVWIMPLNGRGISKKEIKK